jgi:DNA-binding response OmpR family regulator
MYPEGILARSSILIVDDDTLLTAALSQQLQMYAEFDVSVSHSASDALSRAKATRFSCLLLDVGLPDMDGREACRVLRRMGIRCPVIMLTGHNTDSDIILGLDSGANDYVTKPFRFGVLQARIRAQLRVFHESADATFAIGPYCFQPSKKVLTNTETSKTVVLRSAIGTLSRAEMMREVWGTCGGAKSHTVETHIYRLRCKIEAEPRDPVILVTGETGYSLNVAPYRTCDGGADGKAGP